MARKIYAHLFEQGYIEQGAIIVDPFAGIGGFALHAMQNGLHFIGVELEQPFVDLGQSCDCTGVTREEWIRYQGRLDKVRYRDGRHICPRCIAEAGRVLPSLNGQTEMFGLPQTTSYRRNSGKIPRTDPHHYSGNIETWEDLELPGTARIVRGDSRNLAALLEGADSLVSSPPYHESVERWGKQRNDMMKDKSLYARYGDADGQLAAMPPGSRAAVVSSPVYPDARDGIPSKGDNIPTRYGSTPGNLGNMRGTTSTDHAIVVSSPPHLDTLASDDPDKRGGLFRDPKRRNDKTLTAEYGDTPGQLGAMPPGDISIVSSPPYSETLSNPSTEIEHTGAGGPIHPRNYGSADGQLANLPVGEAIVSSPPYEGSINAGRNDDRARKRKAERYARGEFIAMRPDVFSSETNIGARGMFDSNYGNTAGQIGSETGTTFWQAAKTIMEQCYQVLAPGAVAVWVLKRFVRNKQIVQFPEQWARLGEACGFETVEWIRAWLVEDRGAQFDLFGGLDERTVERKSFFRRLYEKKYPGNSIDWEDVIIQRKT